MMGQKAIDEDLRKGVKSLREVRKAEQAGAPELSERTERVDAVCRKCDAVFSVIGDDFGYKTLLCPKCKPKETELSETPVIDGEMAGSPAPVSGELNEGERARCIKSLSWLVADAKHRFDDCRGNLDNGSEGGYSDELTEAIELFDELKKGTPAEPGDRQHDADTLKAAYRQGFEHAKKIILAEIQKLVK